MEKLINRARSIMLYLPKEEAVTLLTEDGATQNEIFFAISAANLLIEYRTKEKGQSGDFLI